jgi:hypothetical protein
VKITENTPDRLVMDITGWGNLVVGLVVIAVLVVQGTMLPQIGPLSGWVMWFCLAVVGAILAGVIERCQFWADRTTGTLAVRRKSLLRRSEAVHPLAELAGATLASRRGSKGGRRYRAEVMLTNGTALPLIASFGGRTGPARATDTINSWLGGQAA